VESESEEVEMNEVNDPVSYPSPTSQVSGRAIRKWSFGKQRILVQQRSQGTLCGLHRQNW